MRLNRIGERKVVSKIQLMSQCEDIVLWGLDPLSTLSEMLIDKVDGFYSKSRKEESDRLFYLVYEINNYIKDLKECLDCCFENTYNLIPSYPTGEKEVCHGK